MSGIIWVIIVGFVAGIIARLLSPGPNNPSGFILTTVLGIAGAFLATFIGQAIGHYGPDQGAGFITATIGALLVLFIWNRLVASRVISDPGTNDGEAVIPGVLARTQMRNCARDAERRAMRSRWLDANGRRGSPGSTRSRTMSCAALQNQMHPRIHPHKFAGHVARRRRRQEAHQLRDILGR